MQYYEKTEHISKKDKFEYWGQQIACYKYFFRRGNETNFYLATYPPLRLNILFVKTSLIYIYKRDCLGKHPWQS